MCASVGGLRPPARAAADISVAMLDTVRRSLRRHDLDRRVTLARADATCFDPVLCFGRADFDRVLISYALSMMPDWRGAVAMAMRTVAPDGSLHIVDFGQCEALPAVLGPALRAWLARFSVVPIADFASAMRGEASRGGFACDAEPLYRGYAARATLRPCVLPIQSAR